MGRVVTKMDNKCPCLQGILLLVSNLTLGPCQKTECSTRLSCFFILQISYHNLAQESEVAPTTYESARLALLSQPVLASPQSHAHPCLSKQWTTEHSTGNMDMILSHRFVQRLSATFFFLWNANQ